MRRDLFGDLTNPPSTTGGKSWVVVLATMLIELAAVAAMVVAPLMMTGLIPQPPVMLAFTKPLDPPVPPPPPVSARPEKPIEAPDTRAPIEPPTEIRPEPDIIPVSVPDVPPGTMI